jgi:hypothetical protein
VDLQNLYASPNTVRVIKSGRMKWVWHAACIREMRNAYKNLKGSDHLEDLGIDGKIILKWILRKQCVNEWTGCIWLRIGTNGRLCVNKVMKLQVFHKW